MVVILFNKNFMMQHQKQEFLSTTIIDNKEILKKFKEILKKYY
jgi:hypothetical protein